MIDEWRAKFRGVELGARPYTFSGPILGLGNPPIVTNDFAVNGLDGVYAQGDNFAGRTLGIPITVHGDTAAETETRRRALVAAWAPIRGTSAEALELHLPDDDLASTIFYGRPRGATADLGNLKGGVAEMLLEFLATDPFRYDFDLSTVTLGISTLSGGLLFPASAPFVFGTPGDSGVRDAANSGAYDTWPTLEIAGPSTSPAIENLTTGEVLRFAITLDPGDVLTISTNPRGRSVFLNGSTDRYSTVDPTSTFFALQPGPNLLRYSASGASGSTVAVSWRAAN